jgi:hypothetical protein
MTKKGFKQRELKTSRKAPWCGAPDCPVCHRIVSDAPPDSVRCTRALDAELTTFGKIRGCSAIIHRTVWCTPDYPVWQRSNGYFARNGPVWQRSNGYFTRNGLLQPHSMRYSVRQSQSMRSWRTGQSTGPVRCTTGQPRGPTSQSSNGRAPTAGWRGWRTGLSGAPCDSSLPMAIFGGWGYKYPNHPTFNGIQVFHSSTSYKS